MIVTKRESMASLIHDISPTLRHSLQQSHNKGLYYGFRDARKQGGGRQLLTTLTHNRYLVEAPG